MCPATRQADSVTSAIGGTLLPGAQARGNVSGTASGHSAFNHSFVIKTETTVQGPADGVQLLGWFKAYRTGYQWDGLEIWRGLKTPSEFAILVYCASFGGFLVSFCVVLHSIQMNTFAVVFDWHYITKAFLLTRFPPCFPLCSLHLRFC